MKLSFSTKRKLVFLRGPVNLLGVLLSPFICLHELSHFMFIVVSPYRKFYKFEFRAKNIRAKGLSAGFTLEADFTNKFNDLSYAKKVRFKRILGTWIAVISLAPILLLIIDLVFVVYQDIHWHSINGWMRALTIYCYFGIAYLHPSTPDIQNFLMVISHLKKEK
jgi:hypothetical protein